MDYPPSVSRELGGKGKESFFFPLSFRVARIASRRDRAAGDENLQRGSDALQRRFGPCGRRFVSAWEIAQVIDDKPRGEKRRNSFQIGVGHPVKRNPLPFRFVQMERQELFGFLDGALLDVECEKRGEGKFCQE